MKSLILLMALVGSGFAFAGEATEEGAKKDKAGTEEVAAPSEETAE